ncbi:MAG: hypothetical protein IT428_10835 [Planctomycetaceae bacterium]|nr:hypothetical protein [Planctomycetaceae bacterium]
MPAKILSRYLFLWLVATAVALTTARSAEAAGDPVRGDLRTALAELAGELQGLLNDQSETTIAVGQFSGPPNRPTSAGPGFAQTLAEELQKKGVKVKARAKLGVKGEYRLAEVPSENADDARLGVKVLALRVKVAVENEFGADLVNANFVRTIRDESAVSKALGLSAVLPASGSERERDASLRSAVAEPQAAITGSVLRAQAASPYGIEVLVDDKPRAAESNEGLPFVKIERGSTYAVRLINDSKREAAVQLTIDGLSMYAFSELRQTDGPAKGQPRYSTVIVPAGKSVVIHGWHVNNEKTDRFLVTEYAKSAAATLSHTNGVGTITATFQVSWPEGEAAPSDEPGKRRGGAGDATGFGPRIDVKFQEVKRNLGVIRDTVSVRYAK